MKIIYLLPPSEGKNPWGKQQNEKLSFDFKKPYDIAINATQKDLKCQGNRYEQGIALNTQIDTSVKLPAIERYSGVMYKAINYTGMETYAQEYFDSHFYILSGMYGIVQSQDMIGDYKLPIETKGLYRFWWDILSHELENLDADYIVNMLPGAYSKMLDFKKISAKIIQIDFMHEKQGVLKKMTHGVKKVKWEYIYDICMKKNQDIDAFPGTISKDENDNIHVQVIDW